MMKKLSVLISLLLACGILFAQQEDKEAIKKVITKSYVNGLLNKGKVEDIKAGFHEGFDLLGTNNNSLTKWPIYSWIEYHEKKLADDPNPPSEEEKITAKFPIIDVTKTAAIVKIELFKNGKQIFTDYLSLYKFDEGWRIVAKIYYRFEEKK